MSIWIQRGNPLLPYGRGIEAPNIYLGTVEERFPLAVLGDYTMEQRAAAPFPVVPLFEMLGEPPPDSHEEGNPSLGSVWAEFAAKDGTVPRDRLGVLREWRAHYHERVSRGLAQMRLARERQRDVLLAMPGARDGTVLTASDISTAAAEVWAGLNMLLRRAFAEGVSDHGGFGGGVLSGAAPLGGHSEVIGRDTLQAFLDEYLDPKRLLQHNILSSGKDAAVFVRAIERAKREMVELQDEWLALFEETVEYERCRQLYEIAVGYVVDGVPLAVAPPARPARLTAAETDYRERTASILIEHDREAGSLLGGATLWTYSDGRTGRAGRFVERLHVGTLTEVLARVDKQRGKSDATAYRYYFGRFKTDKAPAWLGFENWTIELADWYVFAGQFAEELVERGEVKTKEYKGEVRR